MSQAPKDDSSKLTNDPELDDLLDSKFFTTLKYLENYTYIVVCCVLHFVNTSYNTYFIKIM